MEHGPAKRSDSRQLGDRRRTESTVSEDQDVGRQASARRLDLPVLGGLVPARFEELRLESQVRPHAMIELIGNGGMGSVYRGVRIDEAYQKEVAIKVVKRGLDLDRVVRQFRRERQIAASLEHPNIATLIDGGTTAEGLPYFVMEFIRGKPIDTYCDEMGLKTREPAGTLRNRLRSRPVRP